MTDSGENGPKQRWRDATRFRQGERYKPAPGGGGDGWVKGLVVGAVVLVVIFLTMRIGSPWWLALLFGTLAGGAALSLTRPAATPKTEREIKGIPGLSADEIRSQLAEAEAELTAIDGLAPDFSDPELRFGLNEMTGAARNVLDMLADDPSDLRRSRKFLKVYLPSARAAVEKYAKLGVVNDPELDTKFRDLVAEVAATCRRQAEILRLDDKTDLEVEMEVLAERLKS
ncbi:MAG: 5-bromo-4-chloroindolyl phosphate hydrolysis family protein [Pseudomonadota bacterium]